MFSCPMITGADVGGVLYSFTSVPQMPPTSTFSSAASSAISGMGYSRISVLLGPVRTAANTFSIASFLYRRLRDALFRLQRLAGAFLERRARGQDHGHRAHLLVRRVAAGREGALRDELLRGLHQAMARHDDAVVGGDEVLLRAVLDRAHALLQGGILHADALDAAEAV